MHGKQIYLMKLKETEEYQEAIFPCGIEDVCPFCGDKWDLNFMEIHKQSCNKNPINIISDKMDSHDSTSSASPGTGVLSLEESSSSVNDDSGISSNSSLLSVNEPNATPSSSVQSFSPLEGDRYQRDLGSDNQGRSAESAQQERLESSDDLSQRKLTY